MSAPLHTFICAEEDKHTLTVHYRTQAGELDKITFSSRGEPEGYSLRLVDVGGRRIQKTLTVGMYFAADGAEAVEVMQVTNAEGVKIKDGVLVTHYVQVELPAEDAHVLSNQLYVFMNSAEVLVEDNARRSVMDGISHGDDYIVIRHSRYHTLKLGLTSKHHRFTLTDFGLGYEEDTPGPQYMTFGFLDENGIKRRLNFYAPPADVQDMMIELRAFTKAFEVAQHPKFEAAATSHTLQQAA